MARLLSLRITTERDVVLARQRARQVAALVGFDVQDQTRIATAVSEIARNAYEYARHGTVEFQLDGTTSPQLLTMRIADEGPGILDLPAVLSGRYRSETGMGVGISGARRLVDHFDISSERHKGTTVVLKRLLPARSPVLDAAGIAAVAAELARQTPDDAFGEVQKQNQELLQALDELSRRQEELTAVNRELEDTNRGVVALYAELDEKAGHLRRADELKSRFLSNMTHEFRTPVNSIQALARMLLDRTDGDLTPEQERQVTFIRKAADALAELVADLLDLAKVEAGKIQVHATEFDVSRLFGALRGMLRPLLLNESITLAFEEPEDVPVLRTDEGKVSQILRNFISNALKFTEHGTVTVSARHLPAEQAVAFAVSDTGIGIDPADQERIFDEFTQIDNPIQRRVQGTGLGLPLCRRLAALLGGRIQLESTPGVGSTFTAIIPVVHAPRPDLPVWDLDEGRTPVLVVEDSSEMVMVYERMLHAEGFQVLAAASLREARAAIGTFRPAAIVLDIALAGGEDAWSFLAELKRRPETQSIPVAVITNVEDEGKALALGADAYCRKPLDRHRLVQTVARLAEPDSVRHVLVVDDEEICRYVLRQQLITPRHVITETGSGADALRLARDQHPDVICLDLRMPDLPGDEVLRRLKADPATCDIPVVVITSTALNEADRRALGDLAADVLSKDTVSRERALAAVDAAIRLKGAA